MRSEHIATAHGLAASIDDPADTMAALATLASMEALRPWPGADLATACDLLFALGWIHPRLADAAVEWDELELEESRLLRVATLLGLLGRLTDVVALRLTDDPRGIEPVHQMLGARLADQTAMGTALEATLDDLGARPAGAAAAAATLALAYDVAVAASEAASLAATSDPTRARVGNRRAWLNEQTAEAFPLLLLDEVAADLEAHTVT